MPFSHHTRLLLVNRTMPLNAPLSQASGAPPAGLGRLSRWAGVLALLAMVLALDATTGYEVSVFLLYTFPVAVSTRSLGTRAGVVVSLLSAGAWVWADRWSGHVYSQDWFLGVNAFNRLCCFLLAVVAIRYIEERRAAMDLRLRAFTGEVPSCTQCERLCGEDGHWRSTAAYLGEFGGARLAAKVCPDCARRGYARAAYRGSSEAGAANAAGAVHAHSPDAPDVPAAQR